MKVLELRFKNLNSLRGEWKVDFRNEAYAEDGIFAIVGPTGAGKTTILDAICLALYGRTPRLKQISKSGNEVMSRNTGECYAEVVFQTVEGVYRCNWEQHRARKKAEGKLVEASHEICDAESGAVLESKKRQVAQLIEEKTGMDFERFTRSMLLAQGGFAQFLQASADERAPILEQITGTSIYSDISKQVHERHRVERERLELLEAEVKGVVLLGDEEVEEIRRELKGVEEAVSGTRVELEKVVVSIQWLEGVSRLRGECDQAETVREGVEAEVKMFSVEREKLKRAMKAVELEGGYEKLQTGRERLLKDEQECEESRKALVKVEEEVKLKEVELDKVKVAITKAKEALQGERGVVQEVFKLDERVSACEEDGKKARGELDEICNQLHRQGEIRDGEAQKIAELYEELERDKVYLREHVRDEMLASDAMLLEVSSKQLQEKRVFRASKQEEWKGFRKQLDGECDQVKGLDERVGEWRREELVLQKELERVEGKRDELLAGRLLREYRAERDGLFREKSYLERIASLEEQRKFLKEGEPCPLCGAKEHPYVEGGFREVCEVEEGIKRVETLIKGVEVCEDELVRVRERMERCRSQVLAAEREHVRMVHKRDETESNVQRLADEVRGSEKDVAQVEEEVEKQLLRLGGMELKLVKGGGSGGESWLEDAELKEMVQLFRDRHHEWLECQKRVDVVKQEIHQLEVLRREKEGRITELKKRRSEQEERVQELREAFKNLKEERRELYEDKNPEKEVRFLEEALYGMEEKGEAVRSLYEGGKLKRGEVTARVEELEKRISAGKREVRDFEQEFLKQCERAGFQSEAEYVGDRLEVEEREALTRKAERLDRRVVEVNSRVKDLREKLQLMEAQKLTSLSYEGLKGQRKELEEKIGGYGERSGGLRERLKEHENRAKLYEEKAGAVQGQRKVVGQWGALHELIGSADGKKFRNFAQGLTFETMVRQANQQLRKMSDRYALVRDEREGLELNVMDLYQAGEVRSTKNLSGGESFLVSLALALGLSKMASRNVRVDSLFLDEGFGTLDEDALEMALETLGGLHEEGKLIGVISHIPALKERIGIQLEVRPKAGGWSEIRGAGVEKVGGV